MDGMTVFLPDRLAKEHPQPNDQARKQSYHPSAWSRQSDSTSDSQEITHRHPTIAPNTSSPNNPSVWQYPHPVHPGQRDHTQNTTLHHTTAPTNVLTRLC